jgi:hypothetical protein
MPFDGKIFEMYLQLNSFSSFYRKKMYEDDDGPSSSSFSFSFLLIVALTMIAFFVSK